MKSLDNCHTASLKRHWEMSAILNREPGTFAQSDENQVSPATKTLQNVFTVQQIHPQAIYTGTHIDKFEGCTFINIIQRFLWWSVDDRKAEWELIAERSRHKQALLTLQLHFWSLFINFKISKFRNSEPTFEMTPGFKPFTVFQKLLFHPQAFSLSLYEKFCLHSLMKFVQSMDFEQLFLSRLDWRPVTEESQLNAWARAGKQIKLYMFLFLCFLVCQWPYNKHLINRVRSVCTAVLRSVCTGNLGQDCPIQAPAR